MRVWVWLVMGCLVSAQESDLTLVLLKTGPATDLSESEMSEAMKGHFSNMKRLAEEGVLLMAGPLGPPRSDPSHRGLFIFNTHDLDFAETRAATDPGVKAGVFVFTLHPMTTRDRLTELPRLEKEAQMQREADPEVPDEWQGRAYFLASTPEIPASPIAGDALLFQAKLDAFGPNGEPVWFMALDATTEEQARQIVGTDSPWTLHGWYGTKVLEQLGQKSD